MRLSFPLGSPLWPASVAPRPLVAAIEITVWCVPLEQAYPRRNAGESRHAASRPPAPRAMSELALGCRGVPGGHPMECA